MTLRRFGLDDVAAFDAWLAETPRAVVLMRGVGCPYSERFETAFARETPPVGWALAVREVEEGGWGPVADRHGIELTPTLVAFVEAHEVGRLEAKLLLGISVAAYRRWVRALR